MEVIGFLLILAISISGIEGHGMLLDPPGRSSRWRTNSSAITNYNDNAYFCGGFGVQWYQNGGQCGLCGDDYSIPPPRPNELGGLYGGKGVIVHTYKKSDYTADVEALITANHLGFLYFNLCNMDTFKKETEECYLSYRLKFVDGSDKYFIDTRTGPIKMTIVWPKGLSCKHCILRWTYNTGNNWGVCEDGKGALGCGAQETFKSCADIAIN